MPNKPIKLKKIGIVRKIKIKIFLFFSTIPMPGGIRYKFLKIAGVKFVKNTNEKYKIWIGENCQIDTIHPELIEIGNGSSLTFNTKILTHFLDPNVIPPKISMYAGKVKIGRGVFIGCATVICKPVEIGDYSIIAAGSIVTTNVPAGEIWGGNPARFIKKRPVNLNADNDLSNILINHK